MAKGAPQKGFRMTAKLRARMTKAGFDPNTATPKVANMFRNAPIKNGELVLPVKKESDHKVRQRIIERFGLIHQLVEAVTNGNHNALIISGPPGLGKSYEVEQALAKWDPYGRNHTVVKGYVRTTGLYRLLYQHRHPGNIVVLDDADSIFSSEDSLNILKAALDTKKKRNISYFAEMKMTADADTADNDLMEGDLLPRKFEFQGQVIFLTNYDLTVPKHKYKVHFEALLSRSLYVDCAMHTERDYMIWLTHLIDDQKMLIDQLGLTEADSQTIQNFIKKNYMHFNEISARTALKLGQLFKTQGARWEDMGKLTEFKKTRVAM